MGENGESLCVGLNCWSSVGLLVKSRGLLDTLRGMVSGSRGLFIEILGMVGNENW